MKSKPIFLKVFASYFSIIAILSFVFLLIAFETVETHYMESLAQNMERFFYAIEPNVSEFVASKNFRGLDRFVKRLGEKTKIRITVILVDGKVVADSEKNPLKMENHKNRPEMKESLSNGKGISIRFSTTVKEKMFYIAFYVKNKDVCYVLRESVFMRDISYLVSSLKKKIFFSVFAFTILAIFGAYYFSKNISAPIKDLLSAYKKLAIGDFGVKVKVNRSDELGELAKSFNEMSGKLNELFSQLNEKQEELTGIISSIKEGLAVINDEGIIMLSNDSFKMQFGDSKNKYYWEVVRIRSMVEMIEETKKRKKNLIREIGFDEKIYICSTVFISSKREIIFTVYDITELRMFEKVKKDLTINVSHELRTPLTAIKGFAETLEDEVNDSAKKYVDIIKKNTDRLINIINDLLTLSELEEHKSLKDIKKVNLCDILKNVVPLFKNRMKEKGLSFEIICRGRDFVIEGDAFKLEQVFVNLIDNAYKYTEKGKIGVELIENENEILIKISDTGIGIPKKDMKRVFERFYVVDKSRSKELGGTGLGLSIVKHIVNLHGGSISVESELYKGSVFIIRFPKKIEKV